MRVVVVETPAPVVTWEDADQHLRLSGDTSQQAEVEAMIAAATQHIDGPDGWLGRSIGVQTLEARGPFFDGCSWTLPCRPVIDVESVKYLDTTGVEQTLAPEFYELRGAQIVRAYGQSWPACRSDDENVRVQYTAGYAELPMPIRAAILLMVGDLYRFRDTAALVQMSKVPMSVTVETLLAPFRVYA